jgi:hypothetical protein
MNLDYADFELRKWYLKFFFIFIIKITLWVKKYELIKNGDKNDIAVYDFSIVSF